ncbi:PREDICTED: pentatricopeptide repeat-containing protein At5g50990 [Nicotiana attenuata]|uniref:Pentatricopeptide repeat-containing protein n=1 Tax=Nicotiana attenuata TaxID=49451 RepID=A0A314KKW5_NICAT|nr:PREDICTED: pentatricopeptide repeat-containing protein At5g50990 [Nicotiana attenuata]XP_019229557.1 PREDICTED: pentatricopeptide repeat-containing protein At5g50990 [Nicotiana attenuata]XP_019229559.1 PREDICTED: pentatricopeptide repeat-containing protein At5g50990 [Nicotiana attenuata]XP_019229560.1 PREDICTED: pentatricopeptide repeat-containing protein At5g50990 [Nicotiana attenuata]XP_019229561.1 PREDICTED: pentatricopeptide repeat-containing protein At5g50990 [Nicotiana attenuata]XP_01
MFRISRSRRILYYSYSSSSLFPLWRQNHSSNLSTEPHLSFSPPESHYSQDYHGLLCILEGCKKSPNLRTIVGTHANIIKLGYGMYPSLISLMVVTYVSCDKLNLARQLLDEIPTAYFDAVSANLMIASFMKMGAVDVAKKIFNDVPLRDLVTWNSLIGGYVKNDMFKEALSVFRKMLRSDVEPDGYSFASVITACARLGAIDHAKWVHHLMTEKKVELNYILSSALIDMYSKCGRIEIARGIFDSVDHTNVSVWNALINGLAIHGLALDAIGILSQMGPENVSPDSITFIGLLTACSHCGLVEEGRKYFDLMKSMYLIQPQLEHYGAMVDLLGRAGLLDEAYTMIKEMPIEPDIIIWRTFLSACRIHKNSEMGELASTKISHLGSGDYVLLSNIYCSTNKWDNAEKVRYVMKRKGVRKSSGKSWVEVGNVVHQFKAGDRSHPEAELIYKTLKELIHRTKLEGFSSTTELVLMDISDEEKEENLSFHSEKLALAYGILKSSPGTRIQVSKNLRTCLDCHSWMKVVAKVLNREIIVRDRIRFHHFVDGYCSCGDYW